MRTSGGGATGCPAKREGIHRKAERPAVGERARANWWWQLLFGYVLLLPLSGEALAADEIDRILETWSRHRDGLRSMRLSFAGKGVVPKGTYAGNPLLPAELRNQTVPAQDHACEARTTWLFDYVNNRLRKETTNETFFFDKGVFLPRHQINIFDGATTKNYYPRES